METKIEVWQNKSSLRKTCSAMYTPPCPLLQCWHHTALDFCCCLVHRASSLPVPSTTLSRWGRGGEVPCKHQMWHFDFAFHLLSKNFFCTNSVVWLSQWALCFYRSTEWFVFTVHVSSLCFLLSSQRAHR